MGLILTRHAHEQMGARGIDKEQIESGSKTPQTDGFVVRYIYIKVAYKVIEDKYVIKTVLVE